MVQKLRNIPGQQLLRGGIGSIVYKKIERSLKSLIFYFKMGDAGILTGFKNSTTFMITLSIPSQGIET